jgi:hypothetical protein
VIPNTYDGDIMLLSMSDRIYEIDYDSEPMEQGLHGLTLSGFYYFLLGIMCFCLRNRPLYTSMQMLEQYQLPRQPEIAYSYAEKIAIFATMLEQTTLQQRQAIAFFW